MKTRRFPDLVIGPLNTAGQATLWAKGLRNLGVNAESRGIFSPDRRRRNGNPDRWLLPTTRRGTKTFGSLWNEHLPEPNHYLNESLHTTSASTHSIRQQVQHSHNLYSKFAVVFHGSDIRSPQKHMRANKNSHFALFEDHYLNTLEEQISEKRELIEINQIKTFVTTPDLLHDISSATWLPLSVDIELWDGRISEDSGRLNIMHLPSKIDPPIKGTPQIISTMSKFEKTVNFELLTGLNHSEVPNALARADIVIDQFLIGSYGLGAIEAMASANVVIADLSMIPKDVKKSLIDNQLPIVDCSIDTLEEAIERILDTRHQVIEQKLKGRQFVSRIHSIENSAEIMMKWLKQCD